MFGKRSVRDTWHLVAVVTALLCGSAREAKCQTEMREYPPAAYYLAFEFLHEGDFATAFKTFNSASKAGIRSTEGRWVDSICYSTMMGECFYQMGELRRAVEHYTAALNYFVAYQSWMIRVDFSPGIEPSRRARRAPTWGVSTRGAVVGQFNDRYPILQGRFDNANVLVQGGVIALPEFIIINAHEIARCTALAIRRRRELMGSASRHDPLTDQVLHALSVRPARQNHWSQAWIDVQLGMAAAAAGKIQQAVSDLGNGTLAGGTFDHPLTGQALFELGKLAFEQEQYASASKFFHEASLSAAAFEQYLLVEESLRWSAKTHLVSSQPGPYLPLNSAINWARREARYMEASLLIAASENAAVLRETAAAVSLAEQARRRMARTEMQNGAVGARLAYTSALVNYQTGKLKAGDLHFAKLMGYQKTGSQRLYEIELVHAMYTDGVVGERIAQNLYAHVLREPTGKDWVTEPVETQTALLAPLFAPMESWLAVNLKRREVEVAIEISDRIRRQRFYSTLPMGGRLLALRWVLDAPEDVLSERAVLQRHSLMDQFPLYRDLTQRSAAVRKQLDEMPLLPAKPDVRVNQQRWFQELGTISAQQEILLREIALQRAPAQMAFPPQLDFKKAQSDLREGQFVLSFLRTQNAVFAFAFGRDTYESPWLLSEPNRVEKEIVQLLRGMGQVDRNQAIDVEGLGGDTWKPAAGRLLEQIVQHPLPEGMEELIVVPDGPLWYVPFEALPRSPASSRPLISEVRVRYSPTIALAFPDDRRKSPAGRTIVVAGKLFPRDDESVARAAADRLGELLPRVTPITQAPAMLSGLLATFCDRIVVLSDIDDNVPGPYDWSPMQIDRARPGSSLAHWMALPWGGPREVILPGFHTPAEVGLRNGGTGNDVFLSVCGLMSTGARTILISRWRPGGQSSYDLVREFVQELPYASAADAWQRSVQLVMDSELVLEREPRVRFSSLEKGIRGDHPFFWAGNILVDTGAAPSPTPDAVAEAETP